MPAASVPSRRSGPAGSRHSPRRNPRRGRIATLAGIPSGAGVRWDRLGRVAMLCVLGALVYLYLSAGIHLFSTWRQARRDSGAVTVLEREHGQLLRQHEALGRRVTLEAEARRLGMINRGEQQYIVSGVPNN